MNNQEKNMRLAKLLGLSEYCYHPEYHLDDRHLMPLVYKHKVNLIAPEGEQTTWDACVGSILTTSDKPQTALLDCLIEALEAKKESK
jgi:hypothetical protein